MWWRKIQQRKIGSRKTRSRRKMRKTMSRLNSFLNVIYTGVLIYRCKLPTLPHLMSLQPELKSNLVAMQASQNH
jgi:hypothetical protein